MNVLLLSPYPERIAPAIARTGDRAYAFDERIGVEGVTGCGADFIVSYGYRFLIGADVISALSGRIVNLHVSLLPWNRGSDPNFWSFFDDTPKGVSIHRIDRGIDTGALLAQERLAFGPEETLARSYAALRQAVEALFARSWPAIRAGLQPAHRQKGVGTYHRSADKAPFFARLPLGWDSPVALVEDMGRRHRACLLDTETIQP
jgi:methionyl-tRNA formyltransferase